MLIFTISCEQSEAMNNSDNFEDYSDEYADLSNSEQEHGGEEYDCIHERNGNGGYHTFGSALMSYVGYEEFIEWANNIEMKCKEQNNADCLFYLSNGVQLIKDFNIPREDMEFLMKTTALYYKDYKLDVIYSGDDELIEKYYTTPWWEKDELMLKGAEYSIKYNLVDYSSDENRERYVGNGIIEFNIIEFVRDNNVPKDEFVKLTISALQGYDEYINVQYNVDLIYSSDPRLDYMIEQHIDSAIIDSMYMTSDGIFRDDLIYEKTVEAINSGKDISIDDINKAIKEDKEKYVDDPSKEDDVKQTEEETTETEEEKNDEVIFETEEVTLEMTDETEVESDIEIREDSPET